MAPIPSSGGCISISRQRSFEFRRPEQQQQHQQQQPQQPPQKQLLFGTKNTSMDSLGGDWSENDGCKTPRSKEHRLPEEAPVCPSAPIKPRSCRSLVAPPANGYFVPPDLEHFFHQLDLSNSNMSG